MQLHFGHRPSGSGLGDANGMLRLLVRFSIWVLRNLRSCIRSSTCLSSVAMRSCLLSSMHWSLVMVSSTFGGRPSTCDVARGGGRRGERSAVCWLWCSCSGIINAVLKCSHQTWRCWACCPEQHRLELQFGSSPTWWCAGRPVPASARPGWWVCLCTSRSWSRSRCRGSTPTTPAATPTTSLQSWESSRG